MSKPGIICIVAACILASVNGSECHVKFSCKGDDKFEILNYEFNCPEGTICNKDKVDPCEPCIPPPKSCPFTCKNNDVNFGGFVLKCEDPFVCNKSPKSDCKPCVREKCNEDVKQFSCVTNDTVKIGKYDVKCSTGYKCNSEFLEPCEPCILADEKLNLPFIQPTNTSLLEMVNRPRGIAVDDPDMINCNDGLSSKQPCRPGVQGANYYFKCTLNWNFRYTLSIKPCTDLYGDKLCRKRQGLCIPS